MTHLPSSFVADPFLFIPSNHAILRGEMSDSEEILGEHRGMLSSHRAHTPAMWSRASNAQCDLSRAAPIPGSIPGAESGKVGCYNPLAFPLAPSASFIPPAPLAGPREVPPPSDPWYLFFELKSLVTGAGEIGAAVSFDQGASFSNMGTVLREKYRPEGKSKEEVLHLSYPLVMISEAGGCDDGEAADASDKTDAASSHCDRRTEFLMVPETNLLREIRVYRTDRCCFPFGWSHPVVKLRGERFVDTSIVYSADQGRWFIFTSVEYEARLYMTDGPHARSLVDAPWVAHPASPLYARGSRQFGRNAGRIVPYLGGFLRPSQDCSSFYGEQVHLHHITLLTSREFKEEWIRSIKPSATGPSAAWSAKGTQGLLGRSNVGQVDAEYFASRLHHFDAHYILAHRRPVAGATKAVAAGAKDGEPAADAAAAADAGEVAELPALVLAMYARMSPFFPAARAGGGGINAESERGEGDDDAVDADAGCGDVDALAFEFDFAKVCGSGGCSPFFALCICGVCCAALLLRDTPNRPEPLITGKRGLCMSVESSVVAVYDRMRSGEVGVQAQRQRGDWRTAEEEQRERVSPAASTKRAAPANLDSTRVDSISLISLTSSRHSGTLTAPPVAALLCFGRQPALRLCGLVLPVALRSVGGPDSRKIAAAGRG